MYTRQGHNFYSINVKSFLAFFFMKSETVTVGISLNIAWARDGVGEFNYCTFEMGLSLVMLF